MVRRIHRIVLLFALLIGAAGMNYVEAATYSGTCGAAGNEANVTWVLSTEQGRLVISGTGPMTHYWSLTDIPWYAYREYVRTIFVEPGVTTIGHHAFYDFPNLTTVYTYSSLTSIGVLAFGFCRKITSLEIPKNVTSIGDQALWYNESLRDVYVEWTGDAVPTMPSNIHNFEASQIRLHIPCGQTAAYIAKGWNTKFTLDEALYAGTCGKAGYDLICHIGCDSVITVSGTGKMQDYPQPQYMTIGGLRILTNGSLLSPFYSKAFLVRGAVFEEGVTYIGNNTFYNNCSKLKYLILPSTLTEISSTAFRGLVALSDVYVSWTTAAAIPTWNQSIDVSQATLHVPCGTISLYQNKGWNNKFTITDVLASGTCGSNLTWSLNTCGTLTISGTGAMSNYPGLNMPWKSHRASITSVVISDGVTSIGYNAFNGCSNLTSVTIPPSVTSIEQNAFYGCYAMESLYITDLAAWCNVEFGVSVEATPFMRNNYNSGSTEYLGGGNLYLNGTLVTTLTIPDGITEIKNLTFLGCSSITSIDFNQVTTIGSASFKGCHGLTSVTLPEGVTSLKNAFPYCTQLQSISIPASLTSLTSQTLYHSDALTDIYVYWTDNIPGWPEYFTAKSPQPSITLHVPCGTEELYNTTANWKKYHIEGEGGPYTVTVQAEDPTMGDVSIIVN